MKKILIYGDSNVWGHDTVLDKRINDKYQWSNILADYLGSDYKIIQEGLPGRIAGNYINDKKYKNGQDMFEAIFRSSSPLDYIIIALGTNDLQIEYNRDYNQIYNDLMWYKDCVNKIYKTPKYQSRFFNDKKIPKFIYVLPGNFDYLGNGRTIFDKNSYENRLKLIDKFKKDYNDTFIELDDIDLIQDGVHYSIKGHQQVFDELKKIFN